MKQINVTRIRDGLTPCQPVFEDSKTFKNEMNKKCLVYTYFFVKGLNAIYKYNVLNKRACLNNI